MKNQDSILIFGSSGQIGKSLIRKFTKNNYRVTAVTRSIHQKGYQIKTQSNYGYLELEEIKSFTEDNISFFSIDPLMTNCSVKNFIAFLIRVIFSCFPLTDIELPLVYILVFVNFSNSLTLLLNSPTTPERTVLL